VFSISFQQTPSRTFKVTVSFIEIYGEGIRDLLNTSQFKKEVMILENSEVRFYKVMKVGKHISCLYNTTGKTTILYILIFGFLDWRQENMRFRSE
jgi:hypothetical protein